MKIRTMTDLYVDLLRDMYSGEKQLVKALPKMVEAAVSDDVSEAFASHLEETKEQAQRLEQIFKELGVKANGEDCEAMKGIIAEAEKLIKSDISPNVVDAALIASAQKVEHYEIGSYGTLCAFAKKLGHSNQAKLLHEILEEEKKADKMLTKLAERHANDDALAEAA